jgi:hypothetical protein
MREQFVTHEIAEKLKKLGFNENCMGAYENTAQGLWFHCGGAYPITATKAPLWQQAIDFIRIKFNISVEPSVWVSTTTWVVRNIQTNETLHNINDNDYFKGRLEAFTKAIQTIKK